jgi:predicted ArsR family transcriptional regulator
VDKPLEALRDEIKNRALIYYKIYRELAAVLGSDEAVRLMGRAVYERGHDKGVQLEKKIGEPDLAELARVFAEGKSGLDAFAREVVEVSDTRTVLRLTRCPLAEAWQDAGLSPAEKTTMCNIACQVDFGKFEGAGYRLTFSCRIADGADTCDMEVTRPAAG